MKEVDCYAPLTEMPHYEDLVESQWDEVFSLTDPVSIIQEDLLFRRFHLVIDVME